MPLPDLAEGSPEYELLAPLVTGHVGYLLGAGASMAAGLPDWTELLRRLLAARGVPTDTASALLSRQDNLLVAQAAFSESVDRLGREAAIFEALYGVSDPEDASQNFAPTNLHLAVADDAVRCGPGSASLFTLNYDDLLEEAVAKALLTAGAAADESAAVGMVHARGQALRRAQAPYEVHHLHGLLSRQSKEAGGDTLTLTLSEYEALFEGAPWQRTALHDAMQRGPLLLLGTSYTDPDIRRWFDEARREGFHSPIVVLPRQGMGLSGENVAAVRKVIVEQWNALGANCVIVDDYAEMLQVVRELPYLGEPGYRPPRERVAEVHDRRLAEMSAAQATDAARLAAQAEVLRSVLGDAVNLTLWLHDGRGKLVRWATNDRHYTNQETLRRIEATLESPWIVAQAVCFGDERLQDITVQTTSGDGVPERTGRWQSVAAVPVHLRREGEAPVAVGALSAAGERPLDADTQPLSELINNLATEWGDVLAAE